MHPNLVFDPMSAFPEFGPRTVVSLVPSTTASLFDLGLGDTLVGVTDFCTEPQSGVAGLPKVGGPRSLDVQAILKLNPDLVIANREENNREGVEALAAAGLTVWLAFPQTVRESIADLWSTASLFRSDRAMDGVRYLEQAVELAEFAAVDQPQVRYFCPIWQGATESGERWFMTFNDQTYSSDLLRLFNGANVFGGRVRRYPLAADLGHAPAEDAGERDIRYPRATLDEIIAAQPEVVLLPSEPYAYGEQDSSAWLALLADTPAGRAGRIYTIDGALITWPGTRIARALEDLAPVFMF